MLSNYSHTRVADLTPALTLLVNTLPTEPSFQFPQSSLLPSIRVWTSFGGTIYHSHQKLYAEGILVLQGQHKHVIETEPS